MAYILSASQRSPKEEFKYSNYPEVAQVEESIATLVTYAEKVNSAISAYQERETDKIYLNVSELRTLLDISYTITDKLGIAERVCFDILMNIRDIQEVFHELIYSSMSNGSYLVSDVSLVQVTEKAEV